MHDVMRAVKRARLTELQIPLL